MSKNVTLRIDEEILRKCRHAAVEEDMSLSQWITVQLTRIITTQELNEGMKQRALKRLEQGYHLGGSVFRREELYDRA